MIREAEGSARHDDDRKQGTASVPRLRLLVIDDNQDAADTLALLLGAAGHDVRTAYDGPSGIATARTLLPHAVFCDIGMPGMNGHEVATILRNGVLPTAALIAVTGWGADEDRRKAQDAGFDFHLVKPVDSRAIDAVLEKL